MTPTNPTIESLNVSPNSTPSAPSEESFEEVVLAHNQFHDDLIAGRIDPDGKLRDQHIAYFAGKVIDHDKDYIALRYRITALQNINQKLVILCYMAPHLDHSSVSVESAAMLIEPTVDECEAEWNRYHEDHKSGKLSLEDVPQGHHIAYFAGRIVDHDPDMNLLRNRAAASIAIHPERLVIAYPWMW